MDDMTPAQARRTINDLAETYPPNLLFGVVTGQNDPSAIPDIDERNRAVAAGEMLDEDELRRRIYGDEEPPRGVEETPAGMAAVNDAARGETEINYPVTMDVEVVGQPGERQVEIVPQDVDGPGVDDLEPALEQNYPSDRSQDDPVTQFVEAVVSDVTRAFPRELDDIGFAGRVGSVMVRSDGTHTFAAGTDPAAEFEQTQQSEPGFSRRDRSETTESSRGRRNTEPTTQRAERGQQTLSEAGTVESLSEFADGTVDDDPDRTIGGRNPETEFTSAGSGGERTASRAEGLGRFEQFDAVIRVSLGSDSDATSYIIPPDGRAIDMSLKTDVENRLQQALNIPMMLDAHGPNTTVTGGVATFSDGGDTFDGVDLNDNWNGRDTV